MSQDTETALLGLRLWRCPLGHRSYDLQEAEERLRLRVILFRKLSTGKKWHFSVECSEWPTSDYVEAEMISSDHCEECMEKFRVH